MNSLYHGIVVSRIKKALEDSKIAGNYDNQVLKGRAREIFISDLLIPFLNKDFGICTGIIIDSSGNHSKQIDIIIFASNIVPPVMLAEREGVIPYEAVLATIEVKSTLNSTELVKSIDNSRSIKALKFSTQEIMRPICSVCLKNKSVPQKHTPVSYIFAFNSDIKRKSELKRLNDNVKLLNDKTKIRIDVPISGLCVANKCFIYCTDASADPPKFQTFNNNNDNSNTLEFILNVVNTCNKMAAEREILYFDNYLK